MSKTTPKSLQKVFFHYMLFVNVELNISKSIKDNLIKLPRCSLNLNICKISKRQQNILCISIRGKQRVKKRININHKKSVHVHYCTLTQAHNDFTIDL